MKRGRAAVLLIGICVIIAVIPLLLISDSEFTGADGQAEDVILEINPTYEPWAEPLIEPPGGETESLLFALQAAIGAGVVGGIFGYMIARKKYENKASPEEL